ncbi:MAG: hypothetical protein H6687_00770 [Bacillales bacterium]|nr:hypothetical protein [Bacillales bacterium]
MLIIKPDKYFIGGVILTSIFLLLNIIFSVVSFFLNINLFYGSLFYHIVTLFFFFNSLFSVQWCEINKGDIIIKNLAGVVASVLWREVIRVDVVAAEVYRGVTISYRFITNEEQDKEKLFSETNKTQNKDGRPIIIAVSKELEEIIKNKNIEIIGKNNLLKMDPNQHWLI